MAFKVINAAVLDALQVAFNTAFKDGLNLANSDWPKVASEIKSTGNTNLYGWLNNIPSMREWIGERRLNVLKTSGYSLVNRLFESSIGVARTDIEDDSVGMYSGLFSELGRVSNEHIDREVFDLLKQGQSGTRVDADGNTVSNLCFDGQPFFDADHPIYGVQGESETVLGTQSNLIEGGATAWYLLDCSRPSLKPFIYQNRLDAKLTSMNTEGDEATFMRDEYRHGVRARRAFGYSLPQLAVKSTEPLTAESFERARVRMAGMKTDNERLLGVRATLLVVPPALGAKARLIVKADTIDGTSNTNKDVVDILETIWVAE